MILQPQTINTSENSIDKIQAANIKTINFGRNLNILHNISIGSQYTVSLEFLRKINRTFNQMHSSTRHNIFRFQ